MVWNWIYHFLCYFHFITRGFSDFLAFIDMPEMVGHMRQNYEKWKEYNVSNSFTEILESSYTELLLLWYFEFPLKIFGSCYTCFFCFYTFKLSFEIFQSFLAYFIGSLCFTHFCWMLTGEGYNDPARHRENTTESWTAYIPIHVTHGNYWKLS